MKTEQVTKIFSYFAGDKYRVTVHLGSNVIEIEELIKLSWWKRIFRKNDHVWQRIYFGHLPPIQEIVNFCSEEINKSLIKNAQD